MQREGKATDHSKPFDADIFSESLRAMPTLHHRAVMEWPEAELAKLVVATFPPPL
jgi:hypothetical protein